MRTLVLKLFNRKNRPSFVYHNNHIEVSALLDTGAETPVWCMGESKFLKAYPDAIKLKETGEIHGFGEKPEQALIYIIPIFTLTDGKETYRIINLQLAVCYHPLIGYDFVMSDTMFAKTDMFIHRLNEKRVEFFYENDTYQCAIKKGDGTFSIITFSQEDHPVNKSQNIPLD